MKKFIILPLAIFIAACAADWTGKNFDQFVIEYGTPVSQFQMQSGDTAYSFKRPCPYTPGQEEILVVVSPENIIKGTTTQSRCPSATEHKDYNEYTAPAVQAPVVQTETQAERQKREAKARYDQLYSEYSKANAAYNNLWKEYYAKSNNFVSTIGNMTPVQRDKSSAELDAQKKELDSLLSRQSEMSKEMFSISKKYPDIYRALPQGEFF